MFIVKSEIFKQNMTAKLLITVLFASTVRTQQISPIYLFCFILFHLIFFISRDKKKEDISFYQPTRVKPPVFCNNIFALLHYLRL